MVKKIFNKISGLIRPTEVDWRLRFYCKTPVGSHLAGKLILGPSKQNEIFAGRSSCIRIPTHRRVLH